MKFSFLPPIEVLIQILANLPVEEIERCMLVCRQFHHILCDDASWRYALSRYLNSKPLLFRLSPKSYRREYITRFNLARTFLRPTIAHSHSLEAPAIPLYMSAGQVYLLSSPTGIVSRYLCETGKMDKKRIGLGEGGVSACSMLQHDIITSGYRDGRVGILAVNSRNYQNSEVRLFDGRHTGEVTAVTMWKSVVVSGSFGEIRIWYDWYDLWLRNSLDLELLSVIRIGSFTPKYITFRKKNIIVGAAEGNILVIKDVSSTSVEHRYSPTTPSPLVSLLSHDYIDRPVAVLENAILIKSITIPSVITLTAAAWVQGVDGMILVVGRIDGSIAVWRIGHASHDLLYEKSMFDGPVLGLCIDGFKGVGKCAGSVVVWDLTTGGRLCGFKDKCGRGGVAGIICIKGAVVSSSDRIVKSWSFGGVVASVKKAESKGKGTKRQSQRVLNDEVRRGLEDREDEGRDTEMRVRNMSKFAGDGLSEDEMMRIAMLMSIGDSGVVREDELERALRLSLIE